MEFIYNFAGADRIAEAPVGGLSGAGSRHN